MMYLRSDHSSKCGIETVQFNWMASRSRHCQLFNKELEIVRLAESKGRFEQSKNWSRTRCWKDGNIKLTCVLFLLENFRNNIFCFLIFFQASIFFTVRSFNFAEYSFGICIGGMYLICYWCEAFFQSAAIHPTEKFLCLSKSTLRHKHVVINLDSH